MTYQINHKGKTMPITGYGGLGFRFEGHDFMFRTWMKPYIAARTDRSLEKCLVYVDVFDSSMAMDKRTQKKAKAIFKVSFESDPVKRVVCETVADNGYPPHFPGVYNLIDFYLQAVNDNDPVPPNVRYSNPGWSRLLGYVHSIDGNREYLASLPSGTVLRQLYRSCRQVQSVKYPSRSDMIDEMLDIAAKVSQIGSNEAYGGYTHPVFTSTGFLTEPPTITLDSTLTGKIEEIAQESTPSEAPSGVESLPISELIALAKQAEALKEDCRNAESAFQSQKKVMGDVAREKIEAVKALEAAQAETEALKRATIKAPAVVKSKDGATIDVLGITLPLYNCEAAPKVDENYDLTGWRAAMSVSGEPFEANAAQVAKAIIDGDSVRLVGPPSVGKTSGIRQVAAHIGARFFLVQCGEGASDLTLIGQQTVREASMIWQDGSITAAVRWATNNPDVITLVILDEVDHLQPEVQSLLHGVLEGDLLQFNGDELRMPPNVRFVATANTSGYGDISGRHSAAKVSDSAFTSRWSVTYEVTHLPPEAEERVLIKAGAPAGLAAHAVAVANETRVEGASVSQPIVLRQLLAWASGCRSSDDPKHAWGWRVLANMPEHDRPAVWELTKLKFGW